MARVAAHFIRILSCVAIVPVWGLASSALAYVDLAPTLAKVVSDSKKITVVEVVEFVRGQQTVVLKEVRTLLGDASPEPIQHDVAAAQGGAIPRQILQWAAPGARGVLFTSRNSALVCVGQGWYQMRHTDAGAWKLGKDRPDLPLAYYGNVSRLADHIQAMLAGKDTILTVVAHGADDEAASFDLALNRHSLPGLARLERIRANLKMPPMVMAASANPAYLIGPGPVDEEDIPALIEKLKAPDPMTRIAASEDLRCLGRRAHVAAEPLGELLEDAELRVQLAAAAALLQVAPGDARGVAVLERGLQHEGLTERRDAAQAAGLAGPSAAPLAERLAALLQESDESLRIAALQAISMLGPAAGQTVEAITPMLDDADLAIVAADALGRIGAAAQPALKRLAQMLAAEEPTVRWAAVRAMSQIGGDDAQPAVDFMIRTLPKGTEVEGYNIMIYLALLGPVAKDAAPTIRSTRIKNPVLPSATLWAIEGRDSLPWLQARGPGFGPGGPRGGEQGPDIGTLIYEAYIHELGERLRPTACLLARKLMDGTAGDVPSWGYKILTCGADDVLGIVTPHLADEDLAMRQRAVFALGHMGAAAAPGKERIEAALAKASNEREKRLIAWCLREIERE